MQEENNSNTNVRIDYEELKEYPGAFLHFRVFTGKWPSDDSGQQQPIVSFQWLDEQGRRNTKFAILNKAKAREMGEALLKASDECLPFQPLE
jgi:hypothetical protein